MDKKLTQAPQWRLIVDGKTVHAGKGEPLWTVRLKTPVPGKSK